MFQFDSNLIQVELGNKAMQVFATKDTRGILDKLVGQAPPGWADDLIRAFAGAAAQDVQNYAGGGGR